MGVGVTSAAQATSVLERHANDIGPLRLCDLCRDKDRVGSLVTVYNTSFAPSTTLSDNDAAVENRILIADLSRQRMTLDTLNHLLRLANARDLRKFITQLAWGQNHRTAVARSDRHKSTRFSSHARHSHVMIPTMHMALRVPLGGRMLLADGTNALTEIHREWDRLERLSESIRRGQLRGVTGSMIRDVILIGRGTPVAALQFVYSALLKDERAMLATRFGLVEAAATRIRRTLVGGTSQMRTMRFLTTIDPISAASAVADLDPASTLVISIALNGNEETGLATKTIKSWLLNALGSTRRADHILSKHMLLVTGNDRIVSVINKPERVHIVPEHSRCEAFTTFSPAGLLPLSIIFGWALVNEFIQGAHDMDKHFVETNPRHNLPVLLALTDFWNDILLGSSARVVTPFSDAFAGYPKFVGAIESQTCCHVSDRSIHKTVHSSLVVDAGLDGAFDRAFFQSPSVLNTEIVMAMDSQIEFNAARALGLKTMNDVQAVHNSLMSSLFAHADDLAFGYSRPGQPDAGGFPGSPGQNINTEDEDFNNGNRPSLLLVTGKLDAFACGQLVALAEHRAIVKAHVSGIDPFVFEVGSSLRMNRTDIVKDELQEMFSSGCHEDDNEEDEDDDGGMHGPLNLATKTLLRHYASLVLNQQKLDVHRA